MGKPALGIAAVAWLLFAFLQSPGLTSADTKHDLVADPWGFLAQALYPWTDTFPLGQLQNQAYGYLFPHGLFFAAFSWLPGWVVQRLWWGLLLFVAFAGVVRLLEVAGIGSRSSRVIAGVLFALSPRVLTTLGAISSEAWVVALVPWVLLPVVRARLAADSGAPRRFYAAQAVFSAVAVLCMGAVNAVATAIAVLPAVIFWCGWLLSGLFRRRHPTASPRPAMYFILWWAPAGVLACFWWVGPLLLLGRYSPPFTDYIESAALTTRWLNPLEVLRGTTSWVPFLSTERVAGHALAVEPVFIVATLLVALVGLWGLGRPGRPGQPGLRFGRTWVVILLVGYVAMVAAVSPFSPVAEQLRAFLDGAGAPLRNLHKVDPLVRLPLVVGVAHALRGVEWPGLSRQRWVAWRNPEKNPQVVKAVALALLVVVATAPGWSGRIAAADAYREVPSYWSEATDWLNQNVPEEGHAPARTLILPEARFGRQTWGNTRDEPAQPLLDVPWVVRDSVPLVAPEAIRALDGIQEQLSAGVGIPTLAGSLWTQGVGYLLVRSDLTVAADTPGTQQLLKTLRLSGGFREEATFGEKGAVRIFRVEPEGVAAAGDGEAGATAGDLRIVEGNQVEAVAAGPEALPRLDAADAALGRNPTGENPQLPRTRVLTYDLPVAPDEVAGVSGVASAQTATDTPALRDHNYGNVTRADSAIRADDDRSSILNPVRDYPVRGVEALTQVEETGGRVVASSAADDPTAFGGAETHSSVTAAVDESTVTAWRPAPGQAAGEYLEFRLPQAHGSLGLTLETQGAPARLQITTYLGDKVVAGTTATVQPLEENKITVPAGQADRIRVTIVGTFGDFAIAEATVTATRGDDTADITPRRTPTLPAWAGDAGDAGAAPPNRWVFGHEIPEAVMTRQFTLPQGMPFVVHSDRCESPEGPASEIIVDGSPAPCGEVVHLDAGTHELRARDRWVALTVAEPLFAAAVRQADTAAPLPTTGVDSHGGQRAELPASSVPRVLYTPSSANPGRVAALADGTHLSPITINGWQQGWLVPAGASGPVTITFAATDTYRHWLLAGGIGAAVLLLLTGVFLLIARRHPHLSSPTPQMDAAASATPTHASGALSKPQQDGHVSAAPTRVNRAYALGFGALGTVSVVLSARGPWGSAFYAGDSWIVAVSLTTLVAATCVSQFVASASRRKTSEE
ncbi:MAG TPA: DUF3367 domain-containing protein [Candidatus Corynebacterium gallistercoris]|uniref:DUF3367 domain-containing protein n=1 Tax=Candidatus Corynebacterium gallistercoris TaxID=2838530 RepID=A0A9D1RWJ5_9CORY|nr:DUF3367 domain-containing protein [Candidatus Corynebacterium gallistercoris]